MDKKNVFIAGYHRRIVVLSVLILSIALTGTGFTCRPAFAAADQNALEFKPDISSARALAVIKHAFGEVGDLFYLYPATETDGTVELGFPGELIVSPDKTPLGDLLTGKPPQVTINVEPGALERLFQTKTLPAAKVTDSQGHLMGIVTTRNAMEPFRTGAVVRAPESQPAQNVEVHAGTAHEASPEKPRPAAIDEKAVAAHPLPTPVEKAPVAAEHQPPQSTQKAHAPTGHEAEAAPAVALVSGHGTGKTKTEPSHAPMPPKAEKPHGEASHPATPEPSAPDHQPATAAHGEQGHGQASVPSRPKGVALIEAIIKPMEYELNERFWGWRPNDLIFSGDNVRNFQLGVLEITRRTAIILSERVSRSGESSAFDPKLEDAMNWFMIKPDRYWFPSAESKYQDALDALNEYKERLTKKHARFFNRADNLIPLLMAYEDLLGSCEENLVKATEEDGTPVSFFKADDYIFYTQGVASALLTILTAIEHDFGDVIASRQAHGDLHHAITSCHHAVEINPIVVMDSAPSSIFANHRANLAAPISHARFYLSVLIKTLST